MLLNVRVQELYIVISCFLTLSQWVYMILLVNLTRTFQESPHTCIFNIATSIGEKLWWESKCATDRLTLKVRNTFLFYFCLLLIFFVDIWFSYIRLCYNGTKCRYLHEPQFNSPCTLSIKILPSLLIFDLMHLEKRHAWHWFLLDTSTTQFPPSLHVYSKFLLEKIYRNLLQLTSIYYSLPSNASFKKSTTSVATQL